MTKQAVCVARLYNQNHEKMMDAYNQFFCLVFLKKNVFRDCLSFEWVWKMVCIFCCELRWPSAMNDVVGVSVNGLSIRSLHKVLQSFYLLSDIMLKMIILLIACTHSLVFYAKKWITLRKVCNLFTRNMVIFYQWPVFM